MSACRWLRSARAQDGMCIPGCGSGRNADLVFAVDGIHLRAGDADVRLPYGVDGTTWSFGPWRVRANQPVGLAVHGDADALAPVVAVTRRRFLVPLNWPRQHGVVPLHSTWWPEVSEADRQVVAALVAVLDAEPSRRSLLDEPERVERLAASIGGRTVGVPDPVRREPEVEVVLALRRLGFEHRHGRPLPGDVVPTVDELIDPVMAELAGVAVIGDPVVNKPLVRRAIRDRYVEVDAWPFEGLELPAG